VSDHLDDQLSALLDGELSGAEEVAARAHLAGCPACRSQLEEVGAARTWVRDLGPVDPPFGFYERMLLHQGRPPAHMARRRLGMGFAALAGTAAAALVVVGVGSPRDTPVTPRVEQLVEAHTTAGVTSDPVTQLVSVGVPATFGP
jgi:anti-sigma factor RsiW